ncbi:hypothetical protein HDU77_009005, partial [Chytriomyces hyalinus]
MQMEPRGNMCANCGKTFSGLRWRRNFAKHLKGRCGQDELEDSASEFEDSEAEGSPVNSTGPHSFNSPGVSSEQHVDDAQNFSDENSNKDSDESDFESLQSDAEMYESDEDDAASETHADFTSHFEPFPSKTHAILFSLLFAKRRRMSIEQMKLLWALLEVLGVPCPSLNSIINLRKKVSVVKPVARLSSSGVEIFVRPIPQIIKSVFATPSLAANIQFQPSFVPAPQEMYESLAFATRAPQLWMDNNNIRFYAGDLVLLSNG